MASLTEVVAAVVVHSSAVAFSHFGVNLEIAQAERPQPAQERTVARTPARKASQNLPKLRVHAPDCPDELPLLKA